MNKLIITIIILLLIGGIGAAVYFTMETNDSPFKNKNREKPEGFDSERLNGSKMQKLTEEQILEVQEFFNSNPNNSKIEIYCQENRIHCMYYCMQMNPEYEYCKNIDPQKKFNRDFRK